MPREYSQRIKPHGEIMEILPVAVGFLANPDAALAAQYAIDLSDDPTGVIDKFRLLQGLGKRDEQNDSERICPQIAQPIRPDAALAHPVEFSSA